MIAGFGLAPTRQSRKMMGYVSLHSSYGYWCPTQLMQENDGLRFTPPILHGYLGCCPSILPPSDIIMYHLFSRFSPLPLGHGRMRTGGW